MAVAIAISRLERFGTVPSTQDVARGWLADGVPEICVAVADEQTAGRGRLDRSWVAPPGAALLVSAGFRPVGLAPRHGWRLGAIAALAMLDAVEDLHGDAASGLGLKWPNDLVVRDGDTVLKIGGVLGEAVTQDGRLEAAIVGLGINADWPAESFPLELASRMTSLLEVVGGPLSRDRLLDAWVDRLVVGYAQLRTGGFPADHWAARQVTTGARVSVDLGSGQHEGEAIGVDADTGGLVVRGHSDDLRTHLHGDVVRCRLSGSEATL